MTRMAFGGGEWVKMVNCVLNIKFTIKLNIAPLRCHRQDSEVDLTSPGRAAKKELMLFSFCFIGKQVRQVTVQFAFPCFL